MQDNKPQRVAASDVSQRRERLSPPMRPDPQRLAADHQIWLERSRAAWDARAERWDARAAANAQKADRAADLDRIWDSLVLRPGARLLDAGCGSGHFALALAERGVRVTGVDFSSEMIRLARGHAACQGPAVEWRVGDISGLDDAAGAYDAILARVVLPFVPHLTATLREFRRVLRPGGRLLASVPGALSPIYAASWLRHLPGGDPGNSYLLPWELESLLKEDGWVIVAVWGEWGNDLYETANDIARAPSELGLRLQQATATTWSLVAE